MDYILYLVVFFMYKYKSTYLIIKKKKYFQINQSIPKNTEKSFSIFDVQTILYRLIPPSSYTTYLIII